MRLHRLRVVRPEQLLRRGALVEEHSRSVHNGKRAQLPGGVPPAFSVEAEQPGDLRFGYPDIFHRQYAVQKSANFSAVADDDIHRLTAPAIFQYVVIIFEVDVLADEIQPCALRLIFSHQI